jgi:hypothetical protein
MPDDSRYEVEDPETQKILLSIGTKLKRILEGTGLGFTLFLFNFGPGGAMFYLSSADRQDMIKMLHEFLAKEELRDTKES